MARTTLLNKIVTVDWPKDIQDGGKALLLQTAREGHQRIMTTAKASGLEPSWEAYANRPGNDNLESVVIPGPIVFHYRYLSDVIQWALDELRRQSPHVSGDYVRSHMIFVNGQAVDTVPKNLKADDQIYIANPVPYARRLEVGRHKLTGRPFLIQVPNRIYERVAKLAGDRDKGRMKVSMGYVDLGSWALKYNQKSLIKTTRGYAYSNRQRPDRVVGSAVKSPAIFFKAPI